MPDRILINEPNAAQRSIIIQLYSGATPVNGVTTSTASLLIAKAGANMATPTSWTLTNITGGVVTDGLYALGFAQADVGVLGDLSYELNSTGSPSFTPIQGSVPIVLLPPTVLRYGFAQGGDGTHIILDAAASSTSNFYCGGGMDCQVRIVAGTLAGQSRRAIAYVGSTLTMQVAYAWIGGVPDSTSLFEISAVTGDGGLDAATITSIQSPLATASALTTVGTAASSAASSAASAASLAAEIPTNPLLTTDSRLNNLNAAVGSVPAAVIAATVANIGGSAASLAEFLICILAVVAGNASGIGTGTETFKDAGDGVTTRVTGSVVGGVRTTTITP
jgi:hypothetical protein